MEIARRGFVGLLGAALATPPLALEAGRKVFADDFGARGDGTTLNTRAIQAAIDAAARTGGTVSFRAGTYRTGAVFLKTGITFEIPKGVRILGSTDIAHYPVMMTRAADIEMPWPSALINVYGQDNVRIVGDGMIDGDGKRFWDSYWVLRRTYDIRGLRWAADFDCGRPRLIQIYKANRVEMSGPRLHRAGFWTLHICYSDTVHVSDILISNNDDGRGPSTDGIDVDSSSNVLIERADISCNDDALCLKSGRGVDGLRVGRPAEKIVIRDCVVRDAHAGVTLGSGTTGGFHDVTFDKIDIRYPVPVGILIKSAPGRGGVISNITYSRLRMHAVPTVMRILPNWLPAYSAATIPPDIAPVPAHWKLLTAPVPGEKGMVKITDLHLRDVRAETANTAFEIEAFKEVPIERITFDDVYLDVLRAGYIRNARDFRFTNSKVDAVDGKPVELGNATGFVGL